MLFLIVFILVLFRWPILERFVGTMRMYLLDALMFTVLGALYFSKPGPWPLLGYAVGCISVWWAFSAARNYLRCDEIQRAENEQGSDS